MPAITGVIYCGGRGERHGGRDKGLLRLRGRPLAACAALQLAPQVEELFISINRNGSRYRALGLRAVSDRGPAGAGPLTGLLSVMGRIDTPYIVTLPCDSPGIPPDYVARLWRRLRIAGADICVVRDSGGLFPLHALLKTRLRKSLAAYLAAGEAAAHRWVRRQRWTSLPLDLMNINDPAELRRRTNRGRGRGGVLRHGAAGRIAAE